MIVAGCVAIYPALWIGASQAGAGSPWLAAALVPACVSQYGLFHVLNGRRDPGRLIWVARLAQAAYAFSLWTGLLLLLRAAWLLGAALLGGRALGAGASLLWPGLWLWAPLLLAGWGAIWTYARSGSVRTYDAPIPGLPGPVRILHLSDVHVGHTMRRVDWLDLVARSDALDPDLVVITGDFLTPFSERDHGFLLEGLLRFRAPVFACLGNHDLPVRDVLAAELAAAGVTLLVDAATVVTVGAARVELVGVDFHWAQARRHLTEALAALPPLPADARVLLAHDPRLFAWLDDGRFDLVFSGHTHGGQFGTDMFGVPWSILRPFGVYDQGWWTRGRTRLYVHRGNWTTGLPPRMGVAGEVVVHLLR